MTEEQINRRAICSCGSGLSRRPLYDARAIFCTYVCEKCEAEKRACFRPEIFEDAAYSCCEPIEED